MTYSYNKLNNLLKLQTQIEFLSDSEQFQSDNKQIDFTDFNKNNEFIIYSYITDHYPTVIHILNNNKIEYTELLDEFDNEFIII